MMRWLVACAIAISVVPWPARAQAVAEDQGESSRRAVTGDTGVSWMVVMDRAEFRVLRDFFEPGAVRRMHSHESTYHVVTVVTGTLRITVDGSLPVDVAQGEVLHLDGGVTHSIENIGTVTATIVEVFNKVGN